MRFTLCSLQCSFLDAGPTGGVGVGAASPEVAPRKFDSSLVGRALRSLVLGIEHRTGHPGVALFNHSSVAPTPVPPRGDAQPDIR